MAQRLLDGPALLLSYVWQLLILLGHSRRLAVIRLAAQQATYAAITAQEAELKAFKHTLDVVRRAESELARVDLRLGPSVETATLAYQGFAIRLRRNLAESMAEDLAVIERVRREPTQ